MKKLIPLLSPVLFLAGCGSREEPPAKPVVNVKVARAELADVRTMLRAPATLFAREQANVSSRITAPIRELLVRKGDSVNAGQLLARLENRDLVAQRDEAAAAVTEAQASLERISAGTLPTDIERARGEMVTTQAALNQAQQLYERRQRLFEQGAIPQKDLLLAETQLTQSRTSFEVANKALELLKGQSRDKDIQMARSHLEQAKARLQSIQAQLEFAEIHSPFAATITEQFQFPGDTAKPDSPIFTVMDLSVAVARGQVPEGEAGALRTGQPCEFQPSDGGGASYAGRVSVVNKAVDPARRTVETWCKVPNSKGALRGGAFGSLRIVTGVSSNSVVVPLPAVQLEEGTHKGFVMVAGDKRLAAKRDVEIGEQFDGKVQIVGGLRAGELVIIEGGYGLPDGTEIRWQEEKAK